MTIEQVCGLVADEIRKATRKHGPMASGHEAYAVILEELDELWEEIKVQHPDKGKQVNEAVQVAAMACRFILDVACKP